MVDIQLGIITPVVNLNPRFDPPEWERQGGIDDVVTVALAAEAAGYDWLSCPEHVCIPSGVAETRGGRYWHPLPTLSFVAARTSTIGLLSHVLVLGYHHPLEVVKAYGTLDQASGGRVILGVGVGTLRPEFELLGAPYTDRGARADDAMRAIRAGFGRPAPRYQGPYYSFDQVIVDPCGVDRRIEMWVGGRSRRSLRRAIELGDGWIPFGLPLEALESLLGDEELAERRAERLLERGAENQAERLAENRAERRGFAVILAPEPPLDPVGEPDACARAVSAYAAVGATGLHVRFVHRSRSHYVEQLTALAELVAGLD